MNIVVIGVGGIGSFYGLLLQEQKHQVQFVARGQTLEYLQNNTLILNHPKFRIEKNINVCSMQELIKKDFSNIDVIFLTTKSMSTEKISLELSSWFKDSVKIPYIVSLQNGVENENILSTNIKKEFIIGGLTRLIAAHIVKPGLVESQGEVETILGALVPNKENQIFLNNLKKILDETPTQTILSKNIIKELWLKLIINNGVSASCALLEEKSGVLINNEKTSKLVYGLMQEAGIASKALNLGITQKEVDEMFELMKKFDSIKPSMWIDKNNNKDLELEEICGSVIKYCEVQGLDAPYTRSISTVLAFLYNKTRQK